MENICVFDDFPRHRLVAVIVPSHEGLWKAAGHAGIDESSFITIEELCNDESVKQAFLQELESHGMKLDLRKWEMPAAIHLSLDPWTPDSGLVTATFKLKRRNLYQHYEDQIMDMYSRLD